MTIEEILAGESKNIEFKETLPEKSIKYMKSVVAFANGTGGKIIFGIADKTREVVGFDKEGRQWIHVTSCICHGRYYEQSRIIRKSISSIVARIWLYRTCSHGFPGT